MELYIQYAPNFHSFHPTMVEKIKENLEDKELYVNVLESVEYDLALVKIKKRRQIDDYESNCPFLESFEGEYNVVELECKLENFFIHKGIMEEDP